jgi:hypothetical protein
MTASYPRRTASTGQSGRSRRVSVPAAAEVGLVAAFYLAYETLRAVRHPSVAIALSRGRAIARVEGWLHIGVERAVNNFATAHHLFADVCGYYYATLHFAVTPLMLAWLWRRRRDAYARWRTILSIATAAGLVTYWLLPVAPPRLALAGMTDTLVARNILGAGNPHGVTGLVNSYAAMPSLHVGWAFWVALAATRTSRSQLRWLAWAYPVFTTLVVVATANHFLVDAAAGVAVVLAAAAVARPTRRSVLMSTARPAVEMAALQMPQLLGISDEVDRDDPSVDDSEPDDPDRFATWREYRPGLPVDDRRRCVRCESRSGLQHALGDRLRPDDGEGGPGDHPGVGTEDNIGVEYSQQPTHVTCPGGCQERRHRPPLAG